MFIFNVDGVNLCFTVDLGHQLSPQQLVSIGSVDVLLVQVGGTFTLDAEGAANLVKAMGSKLVIPMHFKTSKCDLPIGEVDDFLTKMSNTQKIEKSEIELSPDTLPAAGTEVWIMNHAC